MRVMELIPVSRSINVTYKEGFQQYMAQRNIFYPKFYKKFSEIEKFIHK